MRSGTPSKRKEPAKRAAFQDTEPWESVTVGECKDESLELLRDFESEFAAFTLRELDI